MMLKRRLTNHASKNAAIFTFIQAMPQWYIFRLKISSEFSCQEGHSSRLACEKFSGSPLPESPHSIHGESLQTPANNMFEIGKIKYACRNKASFPLSLSEEFCGDPLSTIYSGILTRLMSARALLVKFRTPNESFSEPCYYPSFSSFPPAFCP